MRLLGLLGRLVVTLGMLGLAGLSLVHAASEVEPIRTQTSTVLHSSLNAEALQETAEGAFRATLAQDAESANQSVPNEVLLLARASFTVDPLATTSIRSLILGSLANEDPAKARLAMERVVQLNKRDMMATAWLSQRSAENEDFEGLARYLDLTLRSSMRAREMMMEPLVNLLQYEGGVRAVGRLVKEEPVWGPAFWGEFVSNPIALARAEEFFRQSRIPLARLPIEDRGMLYAQMQAAGLYEDLYRLADLDPVVDSSASDLVAGEIFAASAKNPFGWALASKGTFATRIPRGSNKLMIDARSNAFGVVAERIVRLGADTTLTLSMADPVPRDVNLLLALHCADEGQSVDLATIRLGEGERQRTVDATSASCSFGQLLLSFEAGNGHSGKQIVIDSLTLRPR